MSYKPQKSLLNRNTSKKKSLILISSFEAEETHYDVSWKLFHFNGYVYGVKITKILALTEQYLIKSDYLINAEMIGFSKEKLFVKIVRIRNLSEMREDIF